jgi:hypothetical protein
MMANEQKNRIIDAYDSAQDAAANIKVGPTEKKIMTEAFPSNSHRAHDAKEETEEKKDQKVITGTVITRKKSFWRKLKDGFLGEDVGSVGSYIIYDVLIPAAKDTLEDLVKGSIEVLLRGEVKGSRTRRDGGRSYVSYSNYYKSDDRSSRRDTSYVNRARHDFSDIILKSRGEAEEVLSQLVDMVEDYGMASIADLYQMVGVPTNFTDNKYGWDNLSSASVSRVRDGYMLDLPKAILLD